MRVLTLRADDPQHSQFFWYTHAIVDGEKVGQTCGLQHDRDPMYSMGPDYMDCPVASNWVLVRSTLTE